MHRRLRGLDGRAANEDVGGEAVRPAGEEVYESEGASQGSG